MIYLPIYLLSFLWVVPAVRMWRRDSELFNACIAEVRAARLDQREFPAYDAWRKHNRRSVVLIVVVLVVTTVQIMVVGRLMMMDCGPEWTGMECPPGC